MSIEKIFLQFDTIEDAVSANLKIYENFARTFDEVLRTEDDVIVPTKSIASGELVAEIYTIPSLQNNFIASDNAITNKWSDIVESTDTPGKYLIKKPNNSLLQDVSGYVIVAIGISNDG